MEPAVRVGALALILISLLLLLVRFVIERPSERRWLSILSVASFLVAAVPVWLMDSSAPFLTGAGDDLLYYMLSQRTLRTLGEWFDLAQFTGEVGQSGYPLVLTWASQLVKNSTFGLKLVNVFLFLATIVFWYDIARTIGSLRLARTTALLLLAIPVLHLYFLFLFKDLLVVLVQGIFVWGLVRAAATDWSRMVHVWTMLVVSFLVITLRSPLALLNGSVCLLSIWLSRGNSRPRVQARLHPTMLAAIAGFLGMIYLAGQPNLLNRVGIADTGGSLTLLAVRGRLAAVDRTVSEYDLVMARSISFVPLALTFVPLALMGSLSGLSPSQQWGGGRGWAGVLQIPWLLVGVPLFLVGCVSIWKIVRARTVRDFPSRVRRFVWSTCPNDRPDPPRQDSQQTIWVCFIPVFMFLITYTLLIAVTWGIDPFRWRLPAMPGMLLIAALGYVQGKRQHIGMLAGLYWIGLGCLWFLRYAPFVLPLYAAMFALLASWHLLFKSRTLR